MDSSQSNNKAQVKCIQAHNMDKQKLTWEKCQGKHFNFIITCVLVIGQKNELSLEKLLYTIHYPNLSRIYFC